MEAKNEYYPTKRKVIVINKDIEHVQKSEVSNSPQTKNSSPLKGHY